MVRMISKSIRSQKLSTLKTQDLIYKNISEQFHITQGKHLDEILRDVNSEPFFKFQ